MTSFVDVGLETFLLVNSETLDWAEAEEIK